MTLLKGKYSIILIVTLISFSKGQDPGSEFLPNIATFPEGPPAPGDPFEDPLVVTNPGEEVLGDTLATDPGVGDLTPPASLVSDGTDVLTKETAPITDNANVPKQDPPVGGEALVDPGTAADGEIVTGPEGVVDPGAAGDGEIVTGPEGVVDPGAAGDGEIVTGPEGVVDPGAAADGEIVTGPEGVVDPGAEADGEIVTGQESVVDPGAATDGEIVTGPDGVVDPGAAGDGEIITGPEGVVDPGAAGDGEIVTGPESVVDPGAAGDGEIVTGQESVVDPGAAADGEIVTGPDGVVDPGAAADGEIVTGQEGVVETYPGETTLVESGTGVLPVGDGGVVADVLQTATSPMDPTTTTAPVTTVDFNFNLNETFDGRNDLLLLTATGPTANDSTVANSQIPLENIVNASVVVKTTSDIPGEDTVLTDPVNEYPNKIGGAESNTSITVPEREIAPNLIGDSDVTVATEGDITHPSSDVATAEITPDLKSQKNISQRMAILDSTLTSDENMTSVLMRTPEIGNKSSMNEKHTVRNHTGPSDMVDKEVTDSKIIPNTTTVIDTVIEIPGIINRTDTTTNTEDLLSEYEKKQNEFKTFVEANPNTNFPGPPSPPLSLNTQPELSPESNPQIKAVAPEPKLPPSPSTPQDETLDEVPSIQAPPPTPDPINETSSTLPPPPITDAPKKASKPSYQVIDYPIVPPPPPPPPSNVFKTDFGEDISTQKPTAFVYEPEIPFDPDFDYRPPVNTNKVKPEISIERPDRRIATPKTTDSLKKNAYAFVFDESRNQPRNQPRNRPEGGISLLQYQHDNRNSIEATRQATAVHKNAAYRVSDRNGVQNSNSVQALFDKNKKFVAKFGEPGMPFYQDFFEQRPKAFFSAEPTKSKPFYEGQGSNRVNSRNPTNPVNAKQFYQANDRMPPINVLEEAPVSQRGNTVPKIISTAKPVAARFQPRSIKDPQFSRTNPPFKMNKMDNSFEFWYQLMGKDLQNNKIINQKPVPNAYENPMNMGGKVLNRFWSAANSGRKRGKIETKTPRNIHNNNAHVYQPAEAGSLKPKEAVVNKNAFVFEPQMQISPVEVSDPHRMKIKEYTITNNPNLISTTEARLNMGIPTLSKPLESEQLSNNMYSLENPPPINIDNEIPNVAFQTFTTTTNKPNTLPQPTMSSVAAFRMGPRRIETPIVRNKTPDLAFRASSVENRPIPPPIQPLATEYIPSRKYLPPLNPRPKSVNTVIIKATAAPKKQNIRNVPNVEVIPNAMPYVPAEPIQKPRENSIFDLPRPPAISFGSSSGEKSVSKVVVQKAELPPPIKDALPLHQTTTASNIQEPEPTPVPPMFSINSTIVMKLQNDSVTKEELPPSVCHQCHYVSDVCFLSEAGICNRFVECHRNGDQVRAFEKECAIGNFWNPETLACQKSLYVNCSADPCRNPAVKSHPFLGRCRYFWKCNRGRSEFEFCGQNYRYDGIADTCVPDFQCKDEDPPNDALIQESPPEKCLWTAVDGSLDSFTDGIFNQKCAPGTRFDEVQCTCVISNILPEGEICNPDTLMNFEGEDQTAFKDKSGHMNGIGRDNVKLKNGTGFFYGIGKLSFWRYSNVELGPLLAIQVRFFPYGYSKNPMALVSNCNGSPIGATVDIRLNTKSKQATFKLSTNKQLNNFISLPYEAFKWNTATYVYAGDTFTASINDKKETIPVEGSIPNRHPAIQVGGCNRQDGFRGYTDDIKVYNGCIPEEFEYIIFT